MVVWIYYGELACFPISRISMSNIYALISVQISHNTTLSSLGFLRYVINPSYIMRYRSNGAIDVSFRCQYVINDVDYSISVLLIWPSTTFRLNNIPQKIYYTSVSTIDSSTLLWSGMLTLTYVVGFVVKYMSYLVIYLTSLGLIWSSQLTIWLHLRAHMTKAGTFNRFCQNINTLFEFSFISVC